VLLEAKLVLKAARKLAGRGDGGNFKFEISDFRGMAGAGGELLVR
jgi:hypothetical protein